MWQVVGQDRAVDLLRRGLESGRLAHAYLFVGPRHVGKMTLALNLAQALNCQEEERPCGACRSCHRIALGHHPDVQVLGRNHSADATKKEIGRDRMIEIQHAASLRPYEGSHRVFIIDGAEHLSEDAANSLLKTLEEPPANVVFLLLSTDQGLLPATIVSRCQKIELPPIPTKTVEQALIEHWGAAADRARGLARMCHGGLGWAISALGDETLTGERAQKLEQLISLSDASIEERFAYAGQLATRFAKKRESVSEELELWREWWRDLLLIKGDCAAPIVHIAQEAMLRREAEHHSLTHIHSFTKAIGAAMEQLEQNANPRLVLENLMLDIPTKRKAKYGSSSRR